MVSYRADGSSVKNPGVCTAFFSEVEIWARCKSSKNQSLIVYSYFVKSPGVYQAQQIGNHVRPADIGSINDYHYRVERGTLTITTDPQIVFPHPLVPYVRFESVGTKVRIEPGQDPTVACIPE